MADQTQPFLWRALHTCALATSLVREASFDFDQGRIRADVAGVSGGTHVFIAGLARSGTTMLLNLFHETGQFRSLTYRDMPFVLMPNLWRRFPVSARGAGDRRERAHGDGVMIDLDSPEAFEEVFWLTFAGGKYRLTDRLVPHDVDDVTIGKFQRYVAAVIRSSPTAGQLYLSKNNNNILRLPAIRRVFPKALILVPFRHPLAHAQSLLAQHERFCALQKDDRFGRSYMSWLGHHEFGLTHRPFVFSESDAAALCQYTPRQLEYWLTSWMQVYRHLLDHTPGTRFVCYEQFCQEPTRALNAILAETGLALDTTRMARAVRVARTKPAQAAEPRTIESALEVHKSLLAATI